MHHAIVDLSTGDYCWWILLHVNLVMFLVWLCSTCACTGSRSPESAEGWRLQREVQTLWKTDVSLWIDEVSWDLGARSIQEDGARGAHTDHE